MKKSSGGSVSVSAHTRNGKMVRAYTRSGSGKSGSKSGSKFAVKVSKGTMFSRPERKLSTSPRALEFRKANNLGARDGKKLSTSPRAIAFRKANGF